MPSYRTGTVTELLSERAGLQRVEVDGERAYVLTQLIGPVAQGDQVVINTTAVDLGLGTGGWHVVHWNLSRSEWSQPGPGQIMKLRYTSLQVDSGAEEEAGAAEHLSTVLPDLAGLPVVACALHSQVPCVAAAAMASRPQLRIGYVMTDGGALPIALSDTVAELRDRGLLSLTVTAGQAFGGDLEAVNVASGMVLAASAGCDLLIVGTGPGVTGTGTQLGFSGAEVAPILDAAGRLGATPVIALRYSDADPRPRHRGVSHHSLTALRLAHEEPLTPVPAGYADACADLTPIEVQVPDMAALLGRLELKVTTMGRGPDEDPGFFAFAGAAGVLAAARVA